MTLQDAIDIEASFKTGGALDIGVFGSGERLGYQDAQELVRSFIQVLSI